jgi:hypothetical protein
MFHSEGNFTGKILSVVLSESKFSPEDPDAFDVCIQVAGPTCEGKPQDGWWRGEVSGKYGRGNMSGKTQYEITMDALHSAGFEGTDLSTIERQLVGKEIPFKVEARQYDGKTYYDVKYIGGGNFAPKALPAESIAEKVKRLQAKTLQTRSISNGPAAQAKATVTTSTATTADAQDDIPW